MWSLYICVIFYILNEIYLELIIIQFLFDFFVNKVYLLTKYIVIFNVFVVSSIPGHSTFV